MKRNMIVRVSSIGAIVAAMGVVAVGCGGGDSTATNDGVVSDAGSTDGGIQPDSSTETGAGHDAHDEFAVVDSSNPESGPEQCPGGCDDGEICSHGQCVAVLPCNTDNDCSNDSYCDPQLGCTPWGTPPDKTHDPNCVQIIPPGILSPTIRCKFDKAPDSDPFPNHLDVQATPVVVNFHKPASAGPPSIVAPFTGTVPGGYTEGLGIIRVLRGDDCSLEADIGGVDMDGDGNPEWISSCSTPAVADLNGDGIAEIVAFGSDGVLLAFTLEGGTWKLLWKGVDQSGQPFVDPLFNWTQNRNNDWAGPSIHDLDDDGKPEIIREGYVYSSEGKLLSGLPPDYAPAPVGTNPVLANLDGDPAIEFTNGAFIWEWSDGQWHKEPGFPGSNPSGPGYVAVADFGAYGTGLPSNRPEIVVVRGGNVMIYALDGSFALSPVAVPGGGGGNPTVADYDGDGMPEVGVAGADFYTVFDIDCTASPRNGGVCVSANAQLCDDASGTAGACPDGIAWSRKTQDHSSNITGSSVFDFEADGKAEVVYADECFVRVYDGSSGEVLFSQYRSSCTWFENPVVADVDGNFRADLVVPSNLACSQGGQGVSCGGLDSQGVDIEFAGIHCKEGSDCVSGTCQNGLCRCLDSSECCAAKDAAKCEEQGFKCAQPPASIGGPSTCRASHPHGVTGIRVYADSADRWVRSRTIWNQHAYAVTHINEDGTVPKTSQWLNNWEQPELNNFRQNVPGKPNGNSIADPTAGASKQVSCTGTGQAEMRVDICNRGADDMGAGVKVSFYDGNTVVCETKTTKQLSPGQCEQVGCTWDNPPTSKAGAKDITVVANSDGALNECKDGNNQGVVLGVYCDTVH